MEEIWKKIQGYEGYYEISNTDKVRSLERMVSCAKGYRKINRKLIKARINNCGYLDVRLSKDGITRTKFIHVLKAQAFIPNPASDKKEVNHKNGNKLDNSLNNLEWVNHSENVQHAYDTKLINLKTKPIIDICSGKQFSSAKEAAHIYQIKYHTLRNYLNGGIAKNPTCLAYKVAA